MLHETLFWQQKMRGKPYLEQEQTTLGQTRVMKSGSLEISSNANPR